VDRVFYSIVRDPEAEFGCDKGERQPAALVVASIENRDNTR
jgi:hypothetical protein